MRVFSNADIADLLPMADAIEVVEQAMRTVSAGGAEMPLRHAVPVGGANMMGVMSGALSRPQCYGVKLVSLFPENPARGLSGHRGAVVLFEAETGGAVAMMDAGLLTAIRTAAASAVATRALSRPDASRLAVIGTGEQAEHHVAAMLSVRPITEVRIVGRECPAAERFVQRIRGHFPAVRFLAHASVADAVKGADIICTVTNSATPVLLAEHLEDGMHLNIVGASVASKREVDDGVVARASIWVDYRPSAEAQAGEIIAHRQAGNPDPIRAEIGAVLSGEASGRRDASEITLYRSLGVIAQDLAVADFVLKRAQKEGRGTEVAF